MNSVLKNIEVNDYLKNIEKKNDIIQQVLIINTETGETFATNEMKAYSDFERLTKKYGNGCSLFFPVGNTGR